jgi:acyl carrier protein
VLQLDSTSAGLNGDSELLGSVPQLDSMAVVSVLTAIEERFGVTVDDDEIDGRTFASVRSLTTFVERKLEQ